MRIDELLNEVIRDPQKVEKDYIRWKQLVNMPTDMLEKFMQTKEGQEAGLTRAEAKLAGGIRTGRDSARAIIRMRSKPFSKWNDTDIDWMYRQISFISRMNGVKGPLSTFDKEGKEIPTRKLTSLWIWGHIPEGHSPIKYGIIK